MEALQAYTCITNTSSDAIFAYHNPSLPMSVPPPSLPPSPRLYEKLLKVAAKGHHKAMEKVAHAMLFGDYLPQDVPKAKELFEKLALEGFPKSQTVRQPVTPAYRYASLSSTVSTDLPGDPIKSVFKVPKTPIYLRMFVAYQHLARCRVLMCGVVIISSDAIVTVSL